jgi:hypothetical protein
MRNHNRNDATSRWTRRTIRVASIGKTDYDKMDYSLTWSGKSGLRISAAAKGILLRELVGEETIYRSCFVLLFGLLAGVCGDVYRHPMAMAWGAGGAWTG